MLSIYGYKWQSHLGEAVDEKGQLSDAAKTWQKGLSRVTVEQLRYGFDTLVMRAHGWPPSLPEFRDLCLSVHRQKIKSLDEIIAILVRSSRPGSLVDRYQHPLALAIAKRVDIFLLNRSNYLEAKKIVKSVYDDLVENGFDDWPEHAFESQEKLNFDKKLPDKVLAKNHLKLIRKVV